jgi:hypothetical protein
VLFSLTFRVQIGIRLVFPLVVLAIVGLEAAAVRAGQLAAPTRRRLAVATAAAWVLWTAGEAALVWPDGICYTNELWGGTRNAYPYVSEANYDWGQGLKELTAWQRRHHLRTLEVWYFGTDPSLERMPLRQVPLHLPPEGGSDDVLERVRGRYLAASTTLVYGNATGGGSQHCRAAAFLQGCRPVDRTSTFLIYDLAKERQRRRAQLPGRAGLQGSNPSPASR